MQVKPRVGIPQALLYYHYSPLWQTFFEELGAEVIISPPTNKAIVDQGVKQTVDEACFPVKVYMGHVLDLIDKVDYLFIPRLVSVEEKAYICPKLLGLPDMVRHGIRNLPQLISPDINLHQGKHLIYKHVWQIGSLFTRSPWQIFRAFHRAQRVYHQYQQALLQGKDPETALAELSYPEQLGKTEASAGLAHPDLKVAVISHPYTLYDLHASMGLLQMLRGLGVQVFTPENVPEAV
ncbi:MAG TPA: acyl-CoA dehydratase activase-related protein, partial [Bacillota bacterium]|nr:acyl-CoA dehydratase activase-related protein [Bacillota bacterium]